MVCYKCITFFSIIVTNMFLIKDLRFWAQKKKKKKTFRRLNTLNIFPFFCCRLKFLSLRLQACI
jgi:hypothetical protein